MGTPGGLWRQEEAMGIVGGAMVCGIVLKTGDLVERT